MCSPTWKHSGWATEKSETWYLKLHFRLLPFLHSLMPCCCCLLPFFFIIHWHRLNNTRSTKHSFVSFCQVDSHTHTQHMRRATSYCFLLVLYAVLFLFLFCATIIFHFWHLRWSQPPSLSSSLSLAQSSSFLIPASQFRARLEEVNFALFTRNDSDKCWNRNSGWRGSNMEKRHTQNSDFIRHSVVFPLKWILFVFVRSDASQFL